jgi:hypothetical protein
MAHKEIRDQVAEEIALQDSVNNNIGERVLPPSPQELFTTDEHTKVYLPRIEPQYLDHSIVVSSPDELAQVFGAVEEFAGGRFSGKDATVTHESQHAKAAEFLGQKDVRFLARLAIGAPFNLEDGRRVRQVALTPATLLEDVRASRLGVGLFLASPSDSKDATEDAKRIQALGYADADAVIRRAAEYNKKTHSDTYHLPRRAK